MALDGASAIAGLLALAALTTTTTIKVTDTFEEIGNLDRKLKRHIRWLDRLAKVLGDIQWTCRELERSGIAINIHSLELNLEDCNDAVSEIQQHIEKKIACLGRKSGLQKRIQALKDVLRSKEIEELMEEVRKIVQSLDLSYSTINK